MVQNTLERRNDPEDRQTRYTHFESSVSSNPLLKNMSKNLLKRDDETGRIVQGRRNISVLRHKGNWLFEGERYFLHKFLRQFLFKLHL